MLVLPRGWLLRNCSSCLARGGLTNRNSRCGCSRQADGSDSVGDIPELISDCETGRVVPAKHPDAFAQTVVELLDDLEPRMSPTAPQDRYHSTGTEQDREADLRRLIPNGYGSAIDAGARDGFYSLILADQFESVIALDLSKPPVEHPRVTAVTGDLTRLPYPDGSFDVVFCTEVLEHIPQLENACSEIVRVCRYEAIIGVPYRQDVRIGRTTCPSCGAKSPPWGHVNSFDEGRLKRLFRPMVAAEFSYVGSVEERTSVLTSWLMDIGGNPWGTYNQETPCSRCGAKLVAPHHRSFTQRVCSAVALRIDTLQSVASRPHANWVHALFRKG